MIMASPGNRLLAKVYSQKAASVIKVSNHKAAGEMNLNQGGDRSTLVLQLVM